MARKRATPLITDIEDIPDELLVPEGEQPYDIPNHWTWVRLSAICLVNPPKPDVEGITDDRDVTFIPMSAISETTGTVIAPETRALGAVKAGYTAFRAGDVLFAKITPCMENGKVAVVESDAAGLAYGSTEFLVLRPSPLLDENFLHTFLRQESFRAEAKAVMSGAVGQQRVPRGFIETLAFPLPPLDEQQAIVKKVQQTIRRLDDVLERLDQLLDQAPGQRAAILQSAVTGALTKSWRVRNNTTWPEQRSGELFDFVTSGSRGWSKYYKDEGTVFLRMGNLTRDSIDFDLSDLQRVALPDEVEGRRSQVSDGDLLITITADVGHVALVRNFIEDAYINQHLALARPAGHVVPEFLAWYLRSPVGAENIRAKQRGATKSGLGLDDIRSLAIVLPQPEEQFEIVRRLTVELEWLDRVLARVRDARDQLVSARKVVRSQAVRGAA
ncbi:restriction endonuclease subunit S [Salinibacterium sp. SWN167]|uniref:restriction endonuclease subunit S n=1 Tax=Salinibacterium sp. SWN167 TaxID=2792054 RepID=UPI0018CF03F4|nr:restriction endonuclease subunit S [Salinibacterium sp. SWN167]MBH0083006.1 restriction endonuclease subunit S [Salinibacterium sp. SWN167]